MSETHITSENKIMVECPLSEKDMKEMLMFLIKYFSDRDYVGLKKENEVYHFNVEKLG